MSKLKTYKFSDLYEMSSGISSKPEQAGHGFPFLSFSTVFNNYFLPHVLPDLMDTSVKEKEVYSIKEGDVFLTRTSETLDELGMSSVAVKEYANASYSGFLKRLRPTQSDITYPKYMAFYLRSNLFRKVMTNNAIMTLRASLNEQIFSYLELILPEFNEQKKIGDLLYQINQKIELNNKINAELEGMAKLIYDYWFVQFDFPNAKGKPYKTCGGKMVWSDELKREIPEGWDVKRLKEFAKTGSGGTPLSTVKAYYENGTLPWINSGEVNQPFIVKAEKFITEDGLNNSSAKMFKQGTILMAMYGATAGKVSLIDIESCTNQAICGINPDKEFYTAFIKFGLEDLYKHLVNLSTGSARDNLSQDKIRDLMFVFPEEKIVKSFHDLTNSSLMKILSNMKENQKLSELRDWLLPMLMNGQVVIKASDNKVKPAKPFKPANTYFHQTQVLGAIINASKQQGIKHGEMTLAKYSYLVDRLYNIPTSFKYDRWHLGPYPTEMKKVVNNKQFFKIQNNEVSVVPQKKEYNFQFQQQVEEAVAELASIFNQYKGKDRSHQTELLATVCKVVEDIQSTDLKAVRESMKKWPIELKGEKFKNKAEKFGEEETKLILLLMSKKGWNKLIVAK